MSGPVDPKRELLRHALATIAFRASRVLVDAPAGFAGFEAGGETRTPGAILAHIGDLLDWAHHLARGAYVWNPIAPTTWEADVDRFYVSLARLDTLFAGDEPLQTSPERLLQGPIADSLTHIGQLAMLRRIAGAPVRGTNYFRAEVTMGRVGPDQP